MDKTVSNAIDKQIENQLLVRNEFLYFGQSDGKYDIPIIRKQNIDVDKIDFLSYVDAKNNDIDNGDKTLHFFTYDWKFEKVYTDPAKELEKLRQYYCLLSPDFSIFTNMPLALQIESIFKNRWCGAYWQSKGLKVIPTVSWGDRNSFDFCFAGIEKGSIVAVSTYYRENCENDFMLGYNEMLKRIEPEIVLCYDEPFPSMKGNIKEFLPTTYEWTKNLDWKDLAQFKWEKRNRNVAGLNPSDFKYFEYEDPTAKHNFTKCSICGRLAMQDDYGNGECTNCGWKFGADEEDLENAWGVSYPLLVSPTTAREQYKKGLPFKATFDEFIRGLNFYGEMLFKHDGYMYAVYYEDEETIRLDLEFDFQLFKTNEDFKNNANINGRLLKDVWDEVTFAGYMYCGRPEDY